MNIHEHQGKELFRKFGLPVPEGKVAYTVDEAVSAAETIKTPVWVVKAQIHAGGRGKGGGVKVAKSVAEVKQYAQAILGMTLVTHQTGPEGKKVQRLLVEEGSKIARELYLAVTLDRSVSKLVIMASTEGGMDIEKVAAETPDKIFKEWVDPLVGLRSYQTRRLTESLKLEGAAAKELPGFLDKLLKLYNSYDCSLLEVNPLVVTADGHLIALDAKLNFDDNAIYRHPDVAALRDETEEDPNEIKAKQFDLSYISLDGNIGCMVNGAGLAMGTMDIIKLEGGDPANFLDVGGGATEDKVREAFKIILGDKKVKAVLVNIFGGIMKCDVIAKGIVAAARELQITIPLVVRLEGTNVEEGKKILSESGLKLITATGMKQAAQRAVAAASGA